MRLLGLVLLVSRLSLGMVMAADKLMDALEAAKANDSRQAVALLTELLKQEPSRAEGYYWRGREWFRLGEVDESLADFDKFVELQPEARSRQWERGITCYYAGKFKEGAAQF